jgi:glycosyltransferase involved in cell wall biosynthesis
MEQNTKREKLSLVIPAYNEEEAIPIFIEEARRIEPELSDVDIEYLFIDDGSKDNTLEVVRRLHAEDARVHVVSFSRNFGKEAAIYAGLENAAGDYVAILDADLQDPPALLPEMLQAVRQEGYDCVGSRRVTRKGEPPIRSFFARMFYRLMNKISSADIVDGARDFQLMNRKVVDAILSMGEYNRFSKGIFGWVGYRKKWLEYENIERSAGETKWSFWKLFLYAMDGIVAFSTAPLVFSSVMGMLFCLAAFIAIIFIIVRTAIFGDPTSGWPSMVCIIMLVSGVQLLCIGILGQYMAKTYLETKNRPKYLVEEQF